MSLKSVIITFVIAFFVQLSLLDLFAIFGHTPHLILCLCFAITFFFNEGYRSIPAAVVAMLLVDICVARYAGVGALALFATCGLILILRRQLNSDQWLATLAAGLSCSLFFGVVYYFLMSVLGDPMRFSYYLGHAIPVTLYDGLVILLIYSIFKLKGMQPDSNEPVEILLEEQDPYMTFEEAARSIGANPPLGEED